ncbi:MAG: hypothetical protein MHM6MM_009581, partial [Cercozoa sp. M6MM]
MALLRSLNARQRAAVLRPFPSATLVRSGPGSGKTRVIVARIVHLIQASEVPNKTDVASQIYALTFTNK